MNEHFGDPAHIHNLLQRGVPYIEAVEHEKSTEEEQHYNEYANFKIKQTKENMKDNKDKNQVETKDLNKDNFRWRVKGEQHELDDMDVDFKLSALLHSLNKADENYAKYNKFQKSANICYENTEYFVKMVDIIQDSLLEDHGLEAPDDKQDVAAMKRLIERGTMKVKNSDAVNERDK